ncbi:FtsX-like permease family protein [Facklamia sp. P13055]|uniref:ABC transporter permease n=1 Tax=Facklamia sp. P13055 TaxID=3421952 RepID=UPI003D16D038
MNKRNFPIFISLFIVSLFFSVVIYYGYNNLLIHYKSTMAQNYADAVIKQELNSQEIKQLQSIETVKLAGGTSVQPDSGLYEKDILAISYQDESINQMRSYSEMIEGHFPENDSQIVLSKSFIDKHQLKLGNRLSIKLGSRVVNQKEVGPLSTVTNEETFNVINTKEYEIVGVYEDVYNKYSKITYALTYAISDQPLQASIKFDSFEEAYKNRETLQEQMSQTLDRTLDLEFNERLIAYFGVENDPIQQFMSKAMIIFSLIVCLALFIFFIKNIFWVWGLRKIKELSVYKSIGTTNLQIYKLLVKEAIWLSIIPILIGHFLGFAILSDLFINIQKAQEVTKIELIQINPLLSLVILLITFSVVLFAVITPTRKITQISIIDGIKGNISLGKTSKKKADNLWQELRLNNLASIKSQTYISAIGIIIISLFLLVVSISRYYTNFGYFDEGYNIIVDYYSKDNEIPVVLKDILKEIPHNKGYISKAKYLSIENNLALSNQAEEVGLGKKLKQELEKMESDYLEGFLIALEEKDLKKMGGEKGQFILDNRVQEDPQTPIAKAKKIPYFKNVEKMDIFIGENYRSKIKIATTINDPGMYESRTLPFQVKLYTDFANYHRLMEDANSEVARYPYKLKINVAEAEVNDVKHYIEAKINQQVAYDDQYEIISGEEVKKNRAQSLNSLIKIIVAIGLIIVILNLTNGYSSINMSLMNRKKEIGMFYSCGMDSKELKKLYLKEFFFEQIKSFMLSIFVTLGVMISISLLSSTLSLGVLINNYYYLLFLGFSLVIYLINILIYYLSLKRILDRPIIDLIRTI